VPTRSTPEAKADAVAAPRDASVASRQEPPVVARMVVEIRSDGSRTIARGALEDLEAGERVAIQAEGATPLALAASLARALLRAPSFVRGVARALRPDRRR
jgi:hypothetical protein